MRGIDRRVREVEAAAVARPRDARPIDLTDAELAQIIGGPGCRPEDLTDADLERIAAGDGKAA